MDSRQESEGDDPTLYLDPDALLVGQTEVDVQDGSPEPYVSSTQPRSNGLFWVVCSRIRGLTGAFPFFRAISSTWSNYSPETPRRDSERAPISIPGLRTVSVWVFVGPHGGVCVIVCVIVCDSV